MRAGRYEGRLWFPGLAARADIGTIIANSLALSSFSRRVYLRLSHFFSLNRTAPLRPRDPPTPRPLSLIASRLLCLSVRNGPRENRGPEDALDDRTTVILN